MGIVELLLLALALSMDAFAVSLCKGLCMKKATFKAGAICGLWFGGFQALMPLIGYFLGSLFSDVITKISPWIAFVLLVLIGANMLKEAFTKEKCESCEKLDLSFKAMFVMAVATSIDALAVGISLAMTGVPVWGKGNIFLAVALIGVITFSLSAAGVKIGSVFGSRYEKKARIAGGVILILLGVKILLEHFGVLPW